MRFRSGHRDESQVIETGDNGVRGEFEEQLIQTIGGRIFSFGDAPTMVASQVEPMEAH